MDIALPTIPAGVLVLLAIAAPYVQALIQHPKWSPTAKKILAVVLAIVLTAIVLLFYYVYTGDTVPAWPVLILLAIVVAQASYTLVTKNTATALERRTSPKITIYETPPKVHWTVEERAAQDARDADVDRSNAELDKRLGEH